MNLRHTILELQNNYDISDAYMIHILADFIDGSMLDPEFRELLETIKGEPNLPEDDPRIER